jgi:hypothetical protein
MHNGAFFFYDSILVAGRAQQHFDGLFFLYFVRECVYVRGIRVQIGEVEVRATAKDHFSFFFFLLHVKYNNYAKCPVLYLCVSLFFLNFLDLFLCLFLVNTYLEQIANVKSVTNKHVVRFS